MRTLILTCDTGEGHNACARAIKEVYDLEDSVCDITDALEFIQTGVKSVMSKGHVFLYRYLPELFNFGYSFSEKHPSTFSENSVFYNILALGSKKLNQLVTERGYDVVICTHPFAAVMLTNAVKRFELKVKTAFVATDYTCCPSVKDSKLNYYFIPDKGLINEFVCETIPRNIIVPSGIPVKQAFFSATDKKEAKLKVGVSPDKKHIVMMSGSMGCGPIEELVEKIVEKIGVDTHLSVICGTNSRLEKSLNASVGDRDNVHIKGFVKDIPLMLDSADIYLTKPGGLSTTEAAVKGIPMLFIEAVAACESYNLLWYVHKGVASGGATVDDLAGMCSYLLKNEDQLDMMRESFENVNRGNAARQIFEILS